jgi:hypothetical protein
MKSPIKANMTAEQAYKAVKTQLGLLMTALRLHLDEHAAKAKADPKNWGYVGDLQYYRDQINQIVNPE